MTDLGRRQEEVTSQEGLKVKCTANGSKCRDWYGKQNWSRRPRNPEPAGQRHTGKEKASAKLQGNQNRKGVRGWTGRAHWGLGLAPWETQGAGFAVNVVLASDQGQVRSEVCSLLVCEYQVRIIQSAVAGIA